MDNPEQNQNPSISKESSQDSKSIIPQEYISILNKDLDVRLKEIELHQSELKLQEKQIEFDFRYSEDFLKKGSDNITDERKINLKKWKFISIILLIALLGSLFFFGYAIHLGQSTLVQEIVKQAFIAAVSILGGYGLGQMKGYRKGKKQSE